MILRSFGLGAAALTLATSPVAADPGDHWKKQWEKHKDCKKKLHEAKSRRDFYQKADECNRELAKLDHEHRGEAAKRWRESEKKWRERDPYYDGGYYDGDD
jgi:hypothetical protein